MGGPERWGDLSTARASDSIAVFWVAGIHGVKDSGFRAEVSEVTVLSGAGGDWRARSGLCRGTWTGCARRAQTHVPVVPPRWHPPLGAEQLGGWGLAVEHVGPLAWAPSHS